MPKTSSGAFVLTASDSYIVEPVVVGYLPAPMLAASCIPVVSICIPRVFSVIATEVRDPDGGQFSAAGFDAALIRMQCRRPCMEMHLSTYSSSMHGRHAPHGARSASRSVLRAAAMAPMASIMGPTSRATAGVSGRPTARHPGVARRPQAAQIVRHAAPGTERTHCLAAQPQPARLGRRAALQLVRAASDAGGEQVRGQATPVQAKQAGGFRLLRATGASAHGWQLLPPPPLPRPLQPCPPMAAAAGADARHPLGRARVCLMGAAAAVRVRVRVPAGGGQQQRAACLGDRL